MTPTDANREAVEVVRHGPGDVAYEAVRSALEATFRRIAACSPDSGFDGMADNLVNGDLSHVQTWVALHMAAQLTAERDALRERCERLEAASREIGSWVADEGGFMDADRLDQLVALASEDRHDHT